MRTELLHETSLYVSDLDVAEKFYAEIIGLEISRRNAGRSTLRYGDSQLVLFQANPPTADSRLSAEPGERGHISLGIWPSELASWREHLVGHHVPIEDEVAWPNGARSITCRDPAGNLVELKTQTRHSDLAIAGAPQSRAMSRGLSAQWKIYQAANLGMERAEASREVR